MNTDTKSCNQYVEAMEEELVEETEEMPTMTDLLNMMNHYLHKRKIIKTHSMFLCPSLDLDSLAEVIKKNSSLTSSNTLHKTTTNDSFVPNKYMVNFIDRMTPLLNQYFGFSKSNRFEFNHYFGVVYGTKYNKNLKLHRDDSDVTINLCLKNNTRTLLSLQTSWSAGEIEIPLQEGEIVIHSGNVPHQVIFRGSADGTVPERVNLIVW
eukprot:CAMPEP_0170176620 /NCGR_PEP_ID=MMETSP0040_2-20121228/9452_1 /TAXON_ID=641309 /ORGANISM="Lotharella oceanica, Strain CCMP622" /LENGTH=207 /DNA_ID=CAMNT_0010418995 /DNA_START=109 /DNA_END=729 /DNA_ORIENTATION=+